MNELCPACLFENPSDATVCHVCGYSLKMQRDIYHLKCQTILVNPDSKNQYKIENTLGEGGFGITYKGFDLERLRQVAIKEYWPIKAARRENEVIWPISLPTQSKNEQLQKFIEEAQNIKLSSHSNIVEVYEWFKANNTAYLIMEYIEGNTLYELVKQNGPLENNKAKKYFLEIADSLRAIHAQNLLHRDIKPDNIMVDKQDRAVLIDFGNAREFIANKTFAMTTCLTPGYAPLEQYSKEGRRSPALDIYSLCATFYYALTGTEPPSATERIDLDPLVPPSQIVSSIEPLLEQIILTGLKVKTTERFALVEDLLESLQGDWSSPNLKKARRLVKQGKLSEAIALYRSCPIEPDALLEKAIVQIWQGDLLGSKEAAYRVMVELEPSNSKGYGILGTIYCRQKKWQLALENLEKADSSDNWILINLAWTLVRLQQWKQAQQTLELVNLTTPLIFGLKSYVSLQNKQYREAVELANMSLAKVGSLADDKLLQWLYFNLIAALSNNSQNNEDVEKALEDFASISVDQNLVNALQIWHLSKNNNWQEALEHCQRSQLADWNLLNYAAAQEQLGLFDQAISIYLIYLTKYPKDYYGLYRVAIIYIHSKQWYLAKEYLERSIEAKPDQPKAYHNLGFVLSNIKNQQGEIEDIDPLLQAYKKAIYFYNQAGENQLASSILDAFRKVKIDIIRYNSSHR